LQVNLEVDRPLLKQLVACLPSMVEACLDQLLLSYIMALAKYNCMSVWDPNSLRSTPLFATIGPFPFPSHQFHALLIHMAHAHTCTHTHTHTSTQVTVLLATHYPTQLHPWLKDLSTTLVHQHANVVTSVTDQVKMVRVLVAQLVRAERAPSGDSTPNLKLRDKVGAALEALLGEGEGATNPLELWREVYKYNHCGQWLLEKDARVQDNLTAVIRTARLLPPEHPFLALQPPGPTPTDQDDGWSATRSAGRFWMSLHRPG
jgi:hypothetical protein